MESIVLSPLGNGIVLENVWREKKKRTKRVSSLFSSSLRGTGGYLKISNILFEKMENPKF